MPGPTRNTGYLQNIVQYDASNNITLPANLTVTGVITGYATTSYVGTQLGGYVPTTRTISINGTSLDLSANRSFTINSMVYPGAGIAVSTGTAWGTSLTDNSSNWNTAYGWGNHAGLYSLLNHTHTFASLTSKPTTLVGYGITDAATSAQGTSADTAYGWGNHASGGYVTLTGTQTISGVKTFSTYQLMDVAILIKHGSNTSTSGYTGIGSVASGLTINLGIGTTGSLLFNTSASYSYTFPAASGTIALTSDLSTYATQTYVGTQIANLVASSPAALDTLNELAAALGNDAAFSTTVSTALGNRLRVDINTQGLSATLQGYGRTNLGLGTAATSNTGDFVAYRTFGTAANSATGDFVAYRTFGTAANNNTGDFALASHTHSIADVTGLQTALDGKQASLGFTPYNSTNPSGYISSYTETDTLASVTGRGATTSTAVSFTGGLTVGTSSVDSNFPFYVTGATTTSRYSLTNMGMGFNLADSYAQLQLYGTSGAYIDFQVSASQDYSGRILYTSASGFNISAATVFSSTISASNFSGTHSGSSSGTNTGDQTNVTGYSNYVNRVANYAWSNSTLPTGYNSGIETSFVSAAQGWPNYGVVLSVMGRVPEDPGGNFQLYMGHGANYGGLGLRVRSVNQSNNLWTSWKILLDETNYSSYALPLTGGSLSGTLNFSQPVGLGFANGQYIKDNGSGGLVIYSGAAININGTTVTAGTLKISSASDNPTCFTNADLGNTFFTDRGGRILTSNGTNWASDGRDAAVVISGSYATTTRGLIGLAFHNETTVTNSFSPMIAFSSKSGSGSYNTVYASIMGKYVGTNLGVDSNWGKGELHFYAHGDAYVDDTPTMRLAGSGYLQVASGGGSSTATLSLLQTGTSNAYIQYTGGKLTIGGDSGLSDGIYFNTYNGSNYGDRVKISITGTLTASGDIVAYGSPSDNRLKTIKSKVSNAVEKVSKLNGYYFDWNEVNDLAKIKEDIGVIAQEVVDVFPELARTNDDGFMSVRYQGLTAVLIEAVKEQQTQIESQKSEIDELKDLVKQLINR